MSRLLNLALSQYGVEEIPGAAHNPEIIKYFTELGFDGSKLGDETSWCAAAINYCLKKADLPYTKALNARSLLEIGVPVANPKMGDVVIFWRGATKDELIPGSQLKKGHVGIYISHTDEFIYCLGGNQSNTFMISPQSKNRLLGYRRVEF
jgi:uncharacterized protein (TIGR02594 family)